MCVTLSTSHSPPQTSTPLHQCHHMNLHQCRPKHLPAGKRGIPEAGNGAGDHRTADQLEDVYQEIVNTCPQLSDGKRTLRVFSVFTGYARMEACLVRVFQTWQCSGCISFCVSIFSFYVSIFHVFNSNFRMHRRLAWCRSAWHNTIQELR